MPRVKIDYIVSFSSEDPEYPASNLLASEVNKKKWLCAKGEPSCSVVLQLSQTVQISGIHIGAHHAALVEVLVGSSEKPHEEFQVLVPSSVFLSPSESRRSEGAERVRSFPAESLAAARLQRWDRLRLVCSQPYNKHCKYGLCFVHVFSPESDVTASAPTPALVPAPARLTLPRFSSEEEDEQFSPGQLFAQYKQKLNLIRENEDKQSPSPSTAATSDTGAQIHQATSQALKNIPDSSIKLTKTLITKANNRQNNRAKEFDSRQRDSILYTDDDERPHAKIDHVVNRHKDEKIRDETITQTLKHKEGNKDVTCKKDMKSDNTPRRDELSNSKRQTDAKDSSSAKDRNKATITRQILISNKKNDNELSSKKNKSDNEIRKRPRLDVELTNATSPSASLRPSAVSASPHTLLSGVRFVLSGYQNPERARIRDTALALGATCRRDWDRSCTHLICAFSNTPKLKQMRAEEGGAQGGGGAVAVKGAWVLQCSAQRRLLPWQWFATEPERYVPPPHPTASADQEPDSENDTDDEIDRVRQNMKKRRTDTSPAPASPPRDPPFCDRSPCDLSDLDVNKEEIQGSARMSECNSAGSDPEPDTDTDVDTERASEGVARIRGGATLPLLFGGATFAVRGEGREWERLDMPLLARYVAAYGGLLLQDEADSADYVLCPPTVRKCSVSPSRCPLGVGECVRADWVWRCHETKSLYPVDEYRL